MLLLFPAVRIGGVVVSKNVTAKEEIESSLRGQLLNKESDGTGSVTERGSGGTTEEELTMEDVTQEEELKEEEKLLHSEGIRNKERWERNRFTCMES